MLRVAPNITTDARGRQLANS